MTTLTAQSRRALLANAHAAWIATSKDPDVDAVHNLKQALVQGNLVQVAEMIVNVRMDGTTVRIEFDNDYIIELDAYGNTHRGYDD